MEIIVFGGSGFVGSHTVEQLMLSGHNVTVFDLTPPKKHSEGLNYIKGDILNYEEVKEAVKGTEVVYNFAGLADLNEGLSRPLDTVQLNILGNLNIMQACVETGVKRFIYASSIYVYSQKGGFYRCSKQSSEIYLEEYNRVYGLQYTILRYGTLYGPGADRSNSIYRYLEQALTQKAIHCKNPSEMREYIHVRDAAKLSVAALGDKYVNERIILSGNYYMKVGEMLEIIREILNGEIEIIYDEMVDKSDHYNYTPYSFSPKIGQKLTPETYTDIGQGLIECLEEISKGHSL